MVRCPYIHFLDSRILRCQFQNQLFMDMDVVGDSRSPALFDRDTSATKPYVEGYLGAFLS